MNICPTPLPHFSHISLPLSPSRLQLEKVLTEKEAQVELQTSEITASEERMRHLQTQLQQTEVELRLKCYVLLLYIMFWCFSL